MRTAIRCSFIVLAALLISAVHSAAASTTINVTPQSTAAYLFNGDTTSPNKTLTLTRGQTYIFQVAATGHPFHITTVTGRPPVDYVDTTNLMNNGTDSGTITFNVTTGTPAQLFYQCANHDAMKGSINIVAAASVPAVSPFALGLLVLAALGAGFFLLQKRVRSVSPGARN
jgi:hypothetical protein